MLAAALKPLLLIHWNPLVWRSRNRRWYVKRMKASFGRTFSTLIKINDDLICMRRTRIFVLNFIENYACEVRMPYSDRSKSIEISVGPKLHASKVRSWPAMPTRRHASFGS